MDASTFISSLEFLSVIHIQGRDAAQFLQGQLTANVKDLNQHQWRYAALCTQQGRVLILCYLFLMNEEYYVILPRTLASLFRSELTKYILRAKVSIQELENLTIFGVHSQASLQENRESLIPPHNLYISKNRVILKIAAERFLLIAFNPETIVANLSQSQWLAADIKEGIVSITPEISGLYTPHALGLPRIGAVSFNKGCYRGQEIIARMEYLGKLKQSLYQVQFHSESPVALPMMVQDTAHKELGQLVNAVEESPQHWIGLAILPKEMAQDLVLAGNKVSIIRNFSV